MSSNYGKISGITPVGSSQFSTAYTPAMTVDDNLNSLWWAGTSDTVRSLTFALGVSRIISRISLYLDSNYPPSSCIISGSNDGASYTTIATIYPAKPSASGWQTFNFTNLNGYTYYKLSFPTLHSSYLYIYEVVLLYEIPWVKADGQKAVIKFTEKIKSDFSAILGYAYAVNNGVVVASNGSVGSISNIANGNYGDYGYFSNGAGNWLQLKFPGAVAAHGMRWYNNQPTGYSITGFTLSGSNDGTTFTSLGTFTAPATQGWHEFAFDSGIAYQYYRITETTYSDSYSYINEVEFKTVPLTCKSAFTVTGQEYSKEPNGTLFTQTYPVESAGMYPDDEYQVLITIDSLTRFEKVHGDLTIIYDSTKGNLSGIGGPVASFSSAFTPSGLVNKPNPNEEERIEISAVQVAGVLTKITYVNAKNDEHVEISAISATGVLTNIHDL